MTPLAEELDGSDAEKMAPMFLSPCDWLVTIYKLMIGQLRAMMDVMFTKCFQKVDRA